MLLPLADDAGTNFFGTLDDAEWSVFGSDAISLERTGGARLCARSSGGVFVRACTHRFDPPVCADEEIAVYDDGEVVALEAHVGGAVRVEPRGRRWCPDLRYDLVLADGTRMDVTGNRALRWVHSVLHTGDAPPVPIFDGDGNRVRDDAGNACFTVSFAVAATSVGVRAMYGELVSDEAVPVAH